MSGRKHTFFLAYAGEDVADAARIYEALDGLTRTFFAETHLDKGTRWGPQAKRAMDSAESVVVLMSKHSRKSEGLQAELDHALKLRKMRNLRVVPVSLDGTAHFELGGSRPLDYDKAPEKLAGRIAEDHLGIRGRRAEDGAARRLRWAYLGVALLAVAVAGAAVAAVAAQSDLAAERQARESLTAAHRAAQSDLAAERQARAGLAAALRTAQADLEAAHSAAQPDLKAELAAAPSRDRLLIVGSGTVFNHLLRYAPDVIPGFPGYYWDHGGRQLIVADTGTGTGAALLKTTFWHGDQDLDNMPQRDIPIIALASKTVTVKPHADSAPDVRYAEFTVKPDDRLRVYLGANRTTNVFDPLIKNAKKRASRSSLTLDDIDQFLRRPPSERVRVWLTEKQSATRLLVCKGKPDLVEDIETNREEKTLKNVGHTGWHLRHDKLAGSKEPYIAFGSVIWEFVQDSGGAKLWPDGGACGEDPYCTGFDLRAPGVGEGPGSSLTRPLNLYVRVRAVDPAGPQPGGFRLRPIACRFLRALLGQLKERDADRAGLHTDYLEGITDCQLGSGWIERNDGVVVLKSVAGESPEVPEADLPDYCKQGWLATGVVKDSLGDGRRRERP